MLKTLLYPVAVTAILSLSACSIFGVYTIDLPQGTPITQAQAQNIQPGMHKNQVLYLIGSPAIRDSLEPNRWDYIYDYTPGTYGEREGKQVIRDASQHLVIYFDDSDIVTRVEGVETLPTTRQ